MIIEIDLPDTVILDANAQLSKYNLELSEKLKAIVKDYALEYRRGVAIGNIAIDQSDFN